MQHQPYSYALVVERKVPRQPTQATAEPDGGSEISEAFRDVAEDLECVQFSAGNPSVEHVTGLVHLYKQQRGSAPLDPQSPSSSNAATAFQVPERGLILCCLAIPADMSVAAFCTFCGAYLEDIKCLQVLRREGSTNNSVCMVLLTFSSKDKADSFYADYNNTPFSSLEPEIMCRLVYVRSVEVIGDQGGALLDPPPGHGELPTCPVCLERLDEHISGVVTTVCKHRFHGECLKRWGDTSCPVCRFCMYSSAATTSRCSVCGSGSNLWICLICGHVGCGRYKSGHANDHWQASQHCYALELETQRVWDYAGDGYVHRLIQSKTDGKLVEVPSPAPPCGHSPAQRRAACSNTRRGGRPGSRGGGSGPDASGRSSEGDEDEDGPCGHCPDCRADAEVKEAMLASKLDAISYEYNHLLASQLDSQRQYWEGALAQQRAEGDARLEKALAAGAARSAAVEVAEAAAREADRKRQGLERKLADATAALAKLKEEKEFLRSLNETLLSNQRDFRAQLATAAADAAAKDATIQDLQEQVRDLMVFIEAQRTIAGSGGELDHATLLPVPEGQQASSSKSRRRPKK